MIAILFSALLAAPAAAVDGQPVKVDAAQGYVVRVDSQGVYIDLGAQAGASVGQSFEVYKEGDELKNPVTGASLGRIETTVTTGLIEQVAPLYSVGSTAKQETVAAGMRARLGHPPAAPATQSSVSAAKSGEASLRAPRTKSPSFSFTIHGMAVADFLGSGKPQLALADSKADIYLFPYPPQDAKPIAKLYVGGVDPRVLSLAAADLEGNGKAQLFVSIYNESLGRVETAVYGVDGGNWAKRAELPWLVRALDNEKGERILAVQQLEDTDFPFSAIYPLEYKNGKYGPGKPAIKHKRTDWLYDFTMAKLDDGPPAMVLLTSNNRLRAQFESGSSSTPDAYGQTPVRMRWPDANGRLLEFHPEIQVVPGGDQKSSLYVVHNIAALESLAEPFGIYNGGEVYRFSWNGVSLQADWKAVLGGYATATAYVARAGMPDDLAVAVDGTSGKSSIWIFDPEAMRRARHKILVVDDDQAIREVLSTQLGRLDFDTCLAADGVEAVAAFKKEKPDLVLMDVLMPRMDGLEACEKIRALEKKNSRVPVIFLTARDGQHDKLSTALSGGDDFVTKPVSLQELRERVESALARAKKK